MYNGHVIVSATKIVIKNVTAIARKKGNNDNGHNRNKKVVLATFLAVNNSLLMAVIYHSFR